MTDNSIKSFLALVIKGQVCKIHNSVLDLKHGRVLLRFPTEIVE